MYLFDTEENRSWQYSEKVTFNLGEKSGEDKNIYAYFLENARKVKIKEEKLLRAEYFFRTTVYVDTDILDKTFDDQSLNTFVDETKKFLPRRKRRKQTYSSRRHRRLNLRAELSDARQGVLYRNYYYLPLKNVDDKFTLMSKVDDVREYYPELCEIEYLISLSESPVVKKITFDCFDEKKSEIKSPQRPYVYKTNDKKFYREMRNAETGDGAFFNPAIHLRAFLWKTALGDMELESRLGLNEKRLSLEEYLNYVETHVESSFKCVLVINSYMFNDSFDASGLTQDEKALFEELRVCFGQSDFLAIGAKILKFLGLEGQFAMKIPALNSYVYSLDCIWQGHRGVFDKFERIEKCGGTQLISKIVLS
ncbi:MAG: hypothetical protein ACLTSK_02765 [Christensenellales bacterium]